MIAITRAVSPTLDRCQLVHLERETIDVERATRQHESYEALLEDLGCVIERVAPAPELPDAVFVEDAAVVVQEVAVLTRPGAVSRRPEIETVAAVLGRRRPLRYLDTPATLDGGDVLRIGRTVLVGSSDRTNRAGAEQLAAHLEPFGYQVRPVPVRGCLHLKTAVTAVGHETVLLNPDWVDAAALPPVSVIEVDPTEPLAANALDVAGTVVVAAAHERTRRRLEAAGLRTAAVDVSELAKAEAGVTCCSILLA